MAAIQSKRFNWVRTATARENIEAWRAKRKSVREGFEATQSAASNALLTTFSDRISAAGDLAARAALKRIQSELQEKIAERSASSDNLIPATKNSVFSVSATTTLDGGSKIDLQGNTLTLTDGTVIDLTTGLKKLNVVV